jgi:uncharacterized protein (DUF2141 family)
MFRHPTGTGEDIPLFLLPHMVMQEIRAHGEEVEWLRARRMNHHYYTVSIRTRPVNREFQKLRLGKVAVPVVEGEAS